MTGRLYPPRPSDSLWSQGSASVLEARALRFDRCALACLGFLADLRVAVLDGEMFFTEVTR